MKTTFCMLICIFLLNSAIAQQKNGLTTALRSTPENHKNDNMPPGSSDGWYKEAVEKIQSLDYAVIQKPGIPEYVGYNKTNNLDFVIDRNGMKISKRSGNMNVTEWETHFGISEITKGSAGWGPADFVSAHADAAKLHFAYKHFQTEYINDNTGMRQNFIINEKPAGEQNLNVKIRLGKLFQYKLMNRNKLYCYSNNNDENSLKLIYDDLKVWDANGKLLPAHMELYKNQLSIVVEDKKATYPITVDPLSHSPEWTTSANGVLTSVLTTGQLQIDALYGFNVAGLGDVNGDGFDDVAIGAPAAISILAGPTTLIGVGAVFVYFGSDTGLSVIPDKILRSNTPVANALFGYSIAGGNVTGNSRNDIIIGAPGESYTASVGGSPATAMVTAGKVYIFRGEDMALPSPGPLLNIYLNGPSYFSRGILFVLGSNITSNALFGFSVAATEDMNGDGLGEVIVGAPGYAELSLLPVKSGAAMVYYSGNLATNTPVKLTAPSSALLGIPALNTGGLLFGFSVDGLGDYNQDGKPDLVVGAPAGVTLTLGNLLGGSAYIYCGNASGINTTFSTQLKAAPSLIGTISNLFGFSVRGVRNANGTRNGNVLVGAPSGNLLSNIAGGLQLKAGSVNVFKSKASPLAAETPAQTIQSPRNSSLLSILTGLNLNLSVLFGASMDNMLDVNCDGINDIIVGEPFSTSIGIISANVLGGSANIFLGKSDGTYNSTPYWTLENNMSYNAGVNAGSLLGYSVAGARHVRGALQGVRSIVGAPGAALDFSSGIFNLGNTVGTLFSFSAGNNGLGKSYMFGFSNCGVVYYPDINVTYVNVNVPGKVSTNDVVPAGSIYGTPVPAGSNPSGGSIIMSPDGNYNFTGTTAGLYTYLVPVCLPGEVSPCMPVELTISVLTYGSTTNPPVANTDIATTFSGIPVIVKSLSNDRCSNLACNLNESSVQLTVSPHNGSPSINAATGDNVYVSNAGFYGKDTLTYTVADNASPSKSASSKQIITVWPNGVANTTLAADDYVTTYAGTSTSGNVKTNDTDPEKNSQAIVPQTTTAVGKGSLSLAADGGFVFVPVANYIGPVNFPYTTCDNGTPSACAKGTLYIMILPLGMPLDVKINSFSYTQKSCSIQLNWSATQDNTLQLYIIDHSVNGLDWASIGMVDARSTATINNYVFMHTNPVKGQNYYRIAMLDKQNVRTYSNVINTGVSCSNVDISVNPNPFSDKLIVYFTTEKSELAVVKLFNDAGAVMTSSLSYARPGANQIRLNDLGWLAAGIYTIQVKTSNGILSQRLLKQ